MGFKVANHAMLDSIRKLSTTFGGQTYVTMPVTRALEISTSLSRGDACRLIRNENGVKIIDLLIGIRSFLGWHLCF